MRPAQIWEMKFMNTEIDAGYCQFPRSPPCTNLYASSGTCVMLRNRAPCDLPASQLFIISISFCLCMKTTHGFPIRWYSPSNWPAALATRVKSTLTDPSLVDREDGLSESLTCRQTTCTIWATWHQRNFFPFYTFHVQKSSCHTVESQ